jgi:hypothetical protein
MLNRLNIAKQRGPANATPSPQEKLLYVGQKFGDLTLQKMQGTTVDIYDALPLDGRTEYKFFKNANLRTFPFTNMGSLGGQLGSGEGLIGKTIQFFFATITGVAVTAVTTLATQTNFLMAEFELKIGNTDVIIKNKALGLTAPFNYSAPYVGCNAKEMETQVGITNFIPIQCNFQPAFGVTVADAYVFCMISGPGAIFAPNTTR